MMDIQKTSRRTFELSCPSILGWTLTHMPCRARVYLLHVPSIYSPPLLAKLEMTNFVLKLSAIHGKASKQFFLL